MVRFRMMGLRPDFDDATRPELDPIPTPRWCESKIQRLMNRQSFPIRYLVEALLMHGRVSIPELDELFALLPRIPSSRQQSILEGLFAWTRSGTITADLIGKPWYFIPGDTFKDNSLHRGRPPYTAPKTLGRTSTTYKTLFDHPNQMYPHAIGSRDV